MAENTWRHLAVAVLVAWLGLGAGCADQQKLREEELGELLAWLPGSYDNNAQAAKDVQAGVHPAHERVALLVVPVNAMRMGHHVFFAQESAADDPRRVMSGRLISFDIDEKRGIIGLMWDFNEPRRWRDGQLNPDIFTGLVVEDVSSAGCEFLWKKSGEQFIATHDPKHCHALKTGAPGENPAELTYDSLNLAGFHFRRNR